MKKNPALIGAAFLMATSSIGPGFLTQTAKFTSDLQASFGFVILISLLLDAGAQVNIWRIVTVSNARAQDIANKLLPGMGWVLAALIVFGGLTFNIGNIAGCGLGLNTLAGTDIYASAGISCLIALSIFWYREAGVVLDNFTKIAGLLMIGLTLYIAVVSSPPIETAMYRTVWPEKINMLTIITLVGGTVGGYISFAGAHRLLDAGVSGIHSIKQVTKSSITGIAIITVMRFVLFLAALGVVTHAGKLDSSNPAGSIFMAAGNIGYRFFGFVMWCAAITSVVGASYTSVSFLKTLHPLVAKNEKYFISAFIVLSTFIFFVAGKPVTLLIVAGAVNGLILPLALAIILLAAVNSKIVGNYKHPLWLSVVGWLIVLVMVYMSIYGISQAITML